MSRCAGPMRPRQEAAVSRSAFLAGERLLLKDLDAGRWDTSIRLMLVELWTDTLENGDTRARLDASNRIADFGRMRAPEDGLGDDPTPELIARHYQERAQNEDDDE